jgi:hypothetical protein
MLSLVPRALSLWLFWFSASTLLPVCWLQPLYELHCTYYSVFALMWNVYEVSTKWILLHRTELQASFLAFCAIYYGNITSSTRLNWSQVWLSTIVQKQLFLVCFSLSSSFFLYVTNCSDSLSLLDALRPFFNISLTRRCYCVMRRSKA